MHEGAGNEDGQHQHLHARPNRVEHDAAAAAGVVVATGAEDHELDSAATTLLASAASSREHSLDGDGSSPAQLLPRRKKYAEIELERYAAGGWRRRGKLSALGKGRDDDKGRGLDRSPEDDDDDDDDDDEEEEDDHEAGEDARLLAHDHRALLMPDGSEPPPAPVTTTTTTLPTAGGRREEGEDGEQQQQQQKQQPVSWSSLPRKGQLAILTLSRLSEPLAQTSLQSYMFYQLKSFRGADGSVPSDSTVAKQAGMLAAAFTAAQLMTALMWGRLADWEGMGRKRVILIGLLGTAIGILGFGFSERFAVAVFWRAVGGMLNGNVGVMRTMVSEIIKEKKFQSRAFLLLPMTFNIGVIIGPLLGGLLADPVGSYPGVFGPGGTLGGKDGVWLFMRWPYALPNLVTGSLLLLGAAGVAFGLEETLEGLKGRPDYGLRLSRWVSRTLFRRRPKVEYSAVLEYDRPNDIELTAAKKQAKAVVRRKLPFRRIWTRNVLLVLCSHGLLAMHVPTFASIWFIFLSTPRYDPNVDYAKVDPDDARVLHLPAGYRPHPPLTFTGGLGLPPPSIGTALAIMGVMGISLQLFLYPRLSFKLGTITSLRVSLMLFPLTYCLAPFLALVPSSRAPPTQASGVLVWLAISAVLTVQVTARTFALPATGILINNSSPHPSVLGTVHGIAQTVSSASKTVGPVLVTWIYAVGLGNGVVGTAWWTMAGIAVVGAVAGRWVKEGDGHEIWLEGEREEAEAEAEAGGGGGGDGGGR